MSSTTVLQLSQAFSDDVSQNGVYHVKLDTPQELSAGDVVSVKSVYLDTSAVGSGTINLENDVPVTLEIAMYVQNYNIDQQFEFNSGNADLKLYPNNVRTVDELGDNNLWWLSEAVELTEDYWEVSGFDVIPSNKTSGTKRFGNADLTFTYDGLTPGQTKQKSTTVHVKSYIDKTWQRHNPHSLNIQCKGTATQPSLSLNVPQAYLAEQGIEKIDFEPYQKRVSPGAGKSNIQLQTFPLTFTVPAGNYTPTELVAFMNNEVASLRKTGFVSEDYGVSSASTPTTKTNWPVMSPCLTTILKNERELYLQGQSTTPASTITQILVNAETGQIADGGAFDKTDIAGKYYMTYDIAAMKADFAAGGGDPRTGYRPPVDRYIGANELNFGYDEAQNKITIETMHFPIYVNDSSSKAGVSPVTIVNDAVPGVEYNSVFGLDSNYVKLKGMATRYAGIAFTSMQPANFWVNQLGFTDTCINPQYNAFMQYPNAGTAVPDNPNSFTIDCIDGKNITGAYPGLDLGVQHHSSFFQRPVFEDFNGAVTATVADTKISTSDTTSIFSNRIWNTSLADYGYFLIDIATNFSQNLVANDTTTSNTQSIVSRYYTANSFTSDDGAGSIAYVHQGEPQMLSSFDVRVRNPDRTFVSDHVLGKRNTIFVNVEKSNPMKR